MIIKRKKLRRYEYNLGGFLKSVAPMAAAAGVSAIPGVGPMLAPLASGLTSAAISGTGNPDEPEIRQPLMPSSLGYRYGGKMRYRYINGGMITTDPPVDSVRVAPPISDEELNRRFIGDVNKGSRLRTTRQETSRRRAGMEKAYSNMAKMGWVYKDGKLVNINEQPNLRGGGPLPITHPIGSGAIKYNGPKHEDGGILIDESGNPTSPENATAEVEGGETRQGDYIFSDSLKVPGTQITFAEAHEQMLKQGASEQEVNKLRMLQEKAQRDAGVQGGDEVPDPRANDVGSLTQEAKQVTNEGITTGEPVRYSRTRKHGGEYRGGGNINIKESKKGTFTAEAKKRGMGVQEFASKVMANKDQYSTAMIKKANFAHNAKKWNKWGGSYQDGGDLTPGYFGVDELPETTLGVTGTGATTRGPLDPGKGGFNLNADKALQTAGYVIPSLTRGVMALTNPRVKKSPKVREGNVPVQSTVFKDAERGLESDYRAILADPNASPNQKLAAQAQLQKGRSRLAGQEADYRGQQQRFNVQTGQQADVANVRSFQTDREIQAREDAAKKRLLTQAIEMPITAYNADRAGRQQQIASVLVDAGKMSDPIARKNHIMRSLRAIGLSDVEIQKILSTSNT